MGFIGRISPRYKFTEEGQIDICNRLSISMGNEEYGKLVKNLLVDVENLKQGKQK